MSSKSPRPANSPKSPLDFIPCGHGIALKVGGELFEEDPDFADLFLKNGRGQSVTITVPRFQLDRAAGTAWRLVPVGRIDGPHIERSETV